MQSWTPDLGASVAPRSRPAVHARPVMARVSLRRAANRRVPLHGAANRRAANCGASVRRAVLLMGPTGAGKSDLAVRLAEEFSLEIVSTDSALVYRGMDIGTAKPDLATRQSVPHHLIDIRDPAMAYSAGDFVVDAAAAMEDIWSRGRQPLFVCGTMLYFHSLSAVMADIAALQL